MKRYFLLFLVLLSVSGYAQNTINNYKYILIPEKFTFLKQKDQYKLNTLTKNLFEDKGFTVYYDSYEIPTEIANNKCNALSLEVTEKSGMFSTGITMILKDCKGNIVFKTKEGKSREKEYEVSYNLALRDAFSSFDAVQYVYQAPAEGPAQQTVTTTVTAPVNQAPVNQAPVKAIAAEVPQAAGTLYAQPTATGYQLIDTAPKKVLTLFKTSADDYFIADNGSSNGIVFKKNDNWFFEYYKNGKLTAEKLSIKF